MITWIQRSFAPAKRFLPQAVWQPVRKIATALAVPVLFSYWTGHGRSSLLARAVSRTGAPLPWYSYPCIDFLAMRDFRKRRVLEFGGGQSTLWWSSRAGKVVTLEHDKEWYGDLKARVPANVEVLLVNDADGHSYVDKVRRQLEQGSLGSFDVVVVDGIHRYLAAKLALSLLTADGIMICDDASGYGFYDLTCNLDVRRVDFFGHQPGTVLPHSTSIFFRGDSFVFDPQVPVPAKPSTG